LEIDQVVQIAGALAILGAFVAAQAGRVSTGSPSYLWANLFGSGLLAATALYGGQWGFLLLEGVWAGVTFMALVGLLPGGAE